MTCEEIRSLIGAYHDGEIVDLLRVQEIESHVEGCQECAAVMEFVRSLSSNLREKAPYFRAPSALMDKIRAETGVNAFNPPAQVVRPKFNWLPAAFVFAPTCAALVAVFFIVTGGAERQYETELIGGHVRSLQASHLFDVPSSDRHTVKPWFQGKLDFTPEVPDLTADGFLLKGGRLDYIAQHPAAALVYSRAKHTINVFVTRPTGVEGSGADTQDGFNIVRWTENGLDYVAISDLNMGELQTFATSFQHGTGPSR